MMIDGASCVAAFGEASDSQSTTKERKLTSKIAAKSIQ